MSLALSPVSNDEDLTNCVAWSEEAMESLAEPNRLAQRDIDYYDGKQWTDAERDVLRKRKQPCITINKIKPKIDLMCGLERRARVDPSALPRTEQDEDNADAATHALRYVKDDNDYDVTRSMVYKDMLLPGVGGIEVVVEPDYQNKNRVINRWIPWDRIVYDPHSRFSDFSDAKYLGVVVWMDYDDALTMFPESADLLGWCMGSANSGRTYDDRPDWLVWTDAKRRRIRFIQMNYLRSGVWMHATFTKGGFLVEPEVSPYLDRTGEPAPQYIFRSASTDQRNARYGYARTMIDAQDEINKRRSKAMHIMSTRQIVVTKGVLNDVDKALQQLAQPDGVIELNPISEGKFEIRDTTDLSEGQRWLLEQATSEMQAMGPNASMSGDDTRDLSGKAIIAQQTGGAIEIAPIADELRQFDRRVYEANWMRIRQFWDEERWIRVTKDGDETKWVGINRQVTLAEAIAAMPQDQAAAYMQAINLQPGDPRLSDVIGTINDVQDMDVDITVDDAPEFPTLMAEQFQVLAGMVQQGINIPPKVLIMASNLRNKSDLLKAMDQAAQEQAQQQQAVQQIGQAKATADIQKTQAQTQQITAQAGQAQATAMDTRIEAIFKLHRAREAQASAFAASQAATILNQTALAQQQLIQQGVGR